MADLRLLYEELGFANVRSYIQSGNVLFESEETDKTVLVGLIETKIEQVYGFFVPALLRQPHDLVRVIETNPFLPTELVKGLYVAFLFAQPEPDLVASLSVPAKETAQFEIGKNELFLFYPQGAGRTKLTNNYLERKLKVSATSRNWRTINKLYEMSKE